MAVRFARRIAHSMSMPVMLVVNVFVGMGHRFVFMFVFMPFGKVQPHTDCHEDCGGHELRSERFIE